MIWWLKILVYKLELTEIKGELSSFIKSVNFNATHNVQMPSSIPIILNTVITVLIDEWYCFISLLQPGIVTSSAQQGRVLTSVGGSTSAIVSSPQVSTTRSGSPVIIASGSPTVFRGATAANASLQQSALPGKATGKSQGSSSSSSGGQLSSSAMDNVKKCRNFLTTLIKLASNANQPPETVQNVKMLVQNLIVSWQSSTYYILVMSLSLAAMSF